MSRFDSRFAGSAGPALMREHGQVVARRPGGSADGARPIEAIWEPPEISRTADLPLAGLTHVGRLHVAADVEPGGDDAYEIDGRVWQTLTVGDPVGGMTTLELRRDDLSRISRRGGSLI